MSRMHWHPQTGEMKIFEDDESEPKGWLDTHPDNVKRRSGGEKNTALATSVADAGAPSTPPITMPRSEIIAALQQGQISFNKNGSAVALHTVLRNALTDVLTARGVEGIDDLTTQDMLDIAATE